MDTRKKAKRIRKTIAVNMVKSWETSPKCDYLMKVNAEPMAAFRRQFNESYGVKVSFLDLVMKAAAIALVEFPFVNSTYNMEEHVHVMHEHINVGFAIAAGDGLIVANVKDTDQCNLIDLNRQTERLIEGARTGALTLDDVTGGSLTINNMGSYPRLVQHTAILNQPELAILSMYHIAEEPVARDGEIRVQNTMNLVLDADHRVIDGKMACEFLARIVELLEEPEQLNKTQ